MNKRRRTKPKLEWCGSYTEDRHFTLPSDVKMELIDILNLNEVPDDAAAMIEEVRRQLSRYSTMVEAIDRKPRPNHKLAQLEPALRSPQHLAMMILAWNNQDILWDFTMAGLYFESAQKVAHEILEGSADPAQVRELMEVAETVRARLASQESRRGRPHAARSHVIWKLCSIFDFYDANDYEMPIGNGHERRPLSQKQLRAEFVAVALRAAKIPIPKLTTRPRSSESRLVRMLPVARPSRTAGLIRRRAQFLRENPKLPWGAEIRRELRTLTSGERRKHHAWAEILRAATKLMAQDPCLSKPQAVTRVCEQEPQLYLAYREAFDAKF